MSTQLLFSSLPCFLLLLLSPQVLVAFFSGALHGNSCDRLDCHRVLPIAVGIALARVCCARVWFVLGRAIGIALVKGSGFPGPLQEKKTYRFLPVRLAGAPRRCAWHLRGEWSDQTRSWTPAATTIVDGPWCLGYPDIGSLVLAQFH